MTDETNGIDGFAEIRCPACSATYRVDRDKLGQTARCRCGNKFEAHETSDLDEGVYTIENAPAAPAGVPSSVPIVACARHPEVSAVFSCAACGAAMCPTCKFTAANGLAVCPDCASTPSRMVSSTRKKLAWWATGLCGFSLLSLVLLISWGASAGDRPLSSTEDAMIGLAGIMGCFPQLVGVGLAFGAVRWRGPNIPVIWVSLVMNVVVFSGWAFLAILGTFMDA